MGSFFPAGNDCWATTPKDWVVNPAMAANESDREDLMREAVALTERIELRVPGFSEFITIGFRSNLAMSVFVGQDPVYQFDPTFRLRRAFVGGFLFRSQLATLAKLQRVRTETETQLLRYDLNSQELATFRDSMLNILRTIRSELTRNSIETMRCVPGNTELLPRICSALEAIPETGDWLSSEIRRRS